MNNQFIQGVLLDWDKIDNDSYLKKIDAFRGIEKLEFTNPITFFVGENGSGKSTLLEAIAVAHGFNPEGGTKNYTFSTHDTHSELCNAIRIAKGYRKETWGYFLRAESFYNVATQEEEYADIAHPSAGYHEKSHGESFLELAQNNLQANGLYLFDEPEAALSPQRQLTFLMEIYRCAKEGAQFLLLHILPYYWAFRMQIFTVLIMAASICALMSKLKVMKLQKCLLTIEMFCWTDFWENSLHRVKIDELVIITDSNVRIQNQLYLHVFLYIAEIEYCSMNNNAVQGN